MCYNHGMKALTEAQANQLLGNTFSDPIPLQHAVVTCSFVYDRMFGYVDVEPGYHEQVMASLYAFRHGHNNYMEFGEARGDHRLYAERYAEEWLQLEGNCFQSSMSKRIYVWEMTHLNAAEKLKFRGKEFVEISKNS